MVVDYSKWARWADCTGSDGEDLTASESSLFVHLPAGPAPEERRELCGLLECLSESRVEDLRERLGWSAVGTMIVPGQRSVLRRDEGERWQVWYDDSYLTTQSVENECGRRLLGHEARGSFVIACMQDDAPRRVSLEEVADFILGRDVEALVAETKAHEEAIAELTK
jgi:hypothetical protein